MLLRGTGDIDCYEQALRGQGLRTVASAGSFWARQEVADLLAHLRALADPGDELALYGVLSCPPVDLSSDALALLARAARERECGVWEVARHSDDGGAARRIGGRRGRRGPRCRVDGPASASVRPRTAPGWNASASWRSELTLAQLLERAIEHGGHAARLRAYEDGERRLANVHKLIGLVGEWERSEGRDLRGFLDEAAFQQGDRRHGVPGERRDDRRARRAGGG